MVLLGTLSYGLESMAPSVLKSMKKKTRPDLVERALEATYRRKIGIQGNFIFGDPAENLSTIKETFYWWGNNRRYQVWLCAIHAYPGTDVYHKAVATGLIKDKLEFHERGCPEINSTQMTDEAWFAFSSRMQFLCRVMLTPGRDFVAEAEPVIDRYRGQLYRLTCTCPHCGERVTYGNTPVDRGSYNLSTLRLACRSCNQRFDMPLNVFAQTFPAEVGIVAEAARSAFDADDLQQAYRLYSKILNAIPTHPEALASLGMILLKACSPDDRNAIDPAINFLVQAVYLNPLEPRYHMALADAFALNGEAWIARLHYRQVMILEPSNRLAKDSLNSVEAILAIERDLLAEAEGAAA
jgi:tetratricopeptide (TPR) repeat protein